MGNHDTEENRALLSSFTIQKSDNKSRCSVEVNSSSQLQYQLVESMHDYLYFEIQTDLANLSDVHHRVVSTVDDDIYKRILYFEKAFDQFKNKINILEAVFQTKWRMRLADLEEKKLELSKHLRMKLLSDEFSKQG